MFQINIKERNCRAKKFDKFFCWCLHTYSTCMQLDRVKWSASFYDLIEKICCARTAQIEASAGFFIGFFILIHNHEQNFS